MEKVKRVTCIGDSITNWNGTHTYCSMLPALLGTGFTVLNCGNAGKTMLKDGLAYDDSDASYWNQIEW